MILSKLILWSYPNGVAITNSVLPILGTYQLSDNEFYVVPDIPYTEDETFIKKLDKGVSEGKVIFSRSESDEEHAQRVCKKMREHGAAPPEWEYVGLCDTSDIPSDRKFRNAWQFDNGKVIVNMDRAKELYPEAFKE